MRPVFGLGHHPSLQEVPAHPSRPRLGPSFPIEKHFVLQPTLYAGSHSMYYSLPVVCT